ncbi:hypothetical protein OG711_26850 [Streptomyces uncialis]|uniref:hypothetical protein n=1 Tax=Streptomyces uncialis TaxID=1048205 RepID=UPI002E336549|nr:hypothetical protein [Streptomyces uncialis]
MSSSSATRVRVDYHQFLVLDEDGPVVDTDEVDASITGLVAVCDGQVEILTGIHSGSVHVTVSSHHHPPTHDPGPWEEISELSFPSPSGTLAVAALMHDLDEELPPLTTAGPGTYRLRVHVRGRDTAVDLTPDDVTEHYLIQCWPAEPTPPTIVRTGDTYGAHQRTRPLPDTTTTLGTPRGQDAQERENLRRSWQNDA